MCVILRKCNEAAMVVPANAEVSRVRVTQSGENRDEKISITVSLATSANFDNLLDKILRRIFNVNTLKAT